ncbi:hypothetical protein G6F68_009993 [Rhizopus microsporus]|nr:hypothetical protein G6F68_009993 [Rhizopus microsporus]
MSFEVDDDFSPSSVETPQLLWDAVKIKVKRATCSFGRKQASWRQLHLSKLQDKPSVRWQEAGETSIKWLKSMYRKRTVEQHITTLRSDDSEDHVEGIDRLLPSANSFTNLCMMRTQLTTFSSIPISKVFLIYPK